MVVSGLVVESNKGNVLRLLTLMSREGKSDEGIFGEGGDGFEVVGRWGRRFERAGWGGGSLWCSALRC